MYSYVIAIILTTVIDLQTFKVIYQLHFLKMIFIVHVLSQNNEKLQGERGKGNRTVNEIVERFLRIERL